jgi:hypothetical protein
MSLLRVWFGATAALLAGAMIWAFAPILVVVLGVLVGLGLVVAVIVAAARAFERRRGGGPGPR